MYDVVEREESVIPTHALSMMPCDSNTTKFDTSEGLDEDTEELRRKSSRHQPHQSLARNTTAMRFLRHIPLLRHPPKCITFDIPK